MLIYNKTSIDDIEGVYELVVEMCLHLGCDIEAQDLMHSLESFYYQDNFSCYGVFDGKKIVGVLGVNELPELFNYNITTAYEMFWYVLPLYRGRATDGLLAFAEENTKADTIQFGVSQRGIVRYLRGKGYVDLKTIMNKEL